MINNFKITQINFSQFYSVFDHIFKFIQIRKLLQCIIYDWCIDTQINVFWTGVNI